MDALVRLLREFPALWLAIGLVISAIVSYVVARRFTPIYAETVKDMANLHKGMVDSYKVQIEELKCERNDYREKLHTEKGDHQNTLLALTELQARPNVDQVYKGQQEFFTKMSGHMDQQTKTMQLIHDSLKEHDQGIEKRTAEVVDRILLGVRKRDG